MKNKFSALQIVNCFRVMNYRHMKQNNSSKPITQLKVMKLLYYVQGIFLAAYGRPAFDENILAWEYGPVVRSVFDKYHGCRELPTIKKNDSAITDYENIQKTNHLSKVVNAIDKELGDWTASQLVRQTHKEYPWKHAEEMQNPVISLESLKQYFSNAIIS